jgi:uracil-DNA glycosylase family 4
MNVLRQLQATIVNCRRCPRLVFHREHVAWEKVRRYRNEEYWGRPIPSWGPRSARLLIVGLAPAAHGGNRTGRIFTGDQSGDFLFRALHRAGFANRAESTHRGDGLRLRGCYITAAVRCAPPANQPLPEELATCREFLIQELQLLPRVRVVIALGRIAFEAFLRAWGQASRPIPDPRPRFGHGSAAALSGGIVLLGSYHPSQQNTQTGRLTPAMLQRIFTLARRRLEGEPDRGRPGEHPKVWVESRSPDGGLPVAKLPVIVRPER